MLSKVSVIGQGYVGLPLALAAASSEKWMVIGYDKNPDQCEKISTGNHDLLDSIEKQKLSNLINEKRYRFTSEVSEVTDSDVLVFCLPTPLDSEGNPDLTILKNSLTEIGPKVKPGSLLILESTSFPGTARNIFASYLMEHYSNTKTCSFAFSPERVDPANQKWRLSNTPKIVAGIDEKSLTRAYEFYSTFVQTLFTVSSLEVAEMSKLIENSYRLVNITMINEIAMLCEKINIPISEVIKAASTKPFGFQAFEPSAGIGGHCIPVDPAYLLYAAKNTNSNLQLISNSLEINNMIPYFVVKKFKNIIQQSRGPILISGVAYKKGVKDIRNSAAMIISKELIESGYDLFWHDNLVDSFPYGKKTESLPSECLGILVIQELPTEILIEANLREIPILDCTLSLNLPNVTWLY